MRAVQSSWRKSITLSDSSGGMPGWTGEDGSCEEVTSTMMAMALSSGEHQFVGGCSGGTVLTGALYEGGICAGVKSTLSGMKLLANTDCGRKA